MEALLRALFAAAPQPLETDSFEGFWPQLVARLEAWPQPADAAVLGGFSADRLGFAFAAGYHAALRRLCPRLPRDHGLALAATETGGAHPRAIATALDDDGRLHGEKSWVTLAPHASELVVLASSGSSGDHKQLVAVIVDARAPGVQIQPPTTTPFAPEIPHARVRFDGAPITSRMDGDGWQDVVKPFRTVEDLHVHLALLGYVMSLGLRSGFPEALLERTLALLVGAHQLARLDPKAAEAHLAVAGLLAETRALVEQLDAALPRAPEAERLRFARDRPLLEVAGKAREARRARAWQRLGVAHGGLGR